MLEETVNTEFGVTQMPAHEVKKQFCIHNQLTGQLEFATTWEGILEKRAKIMAAYLKHHEGLFTITELNQAEDKSWVQGASPLYEEYIRGMNHGS